MASPPRPERDLRLDFFRGLSLFFIFIDHIPENLLSYVTLSSVAFNDAAEVFIFISGYTAALVYGRSQAERGMLYATAQVYRRVWQLYVAHIFIFVIFTAEVSYAIGMMQNQMYSEEMGVGDFLQAPYFAIIRTLFLSFQPTFLDILPLYIVLLATFPLVLIGLAKNQRLPIVLSFVLYLLTRHFGWRLHNLPSGQWWTFNPLAWQLMFVIGAAAGYAGVSKRWPFPQSPWLVRLAIALAALLTLIKISWVVHSLYEPFPGILIKSLWTQALDKTNLAPLRLIDFLTLAITTVYFVRPNTGFLRWRIARPAILCGKHSLYIFCLGILLSVLGHFLLAELYGGLTMQAAVNAGGIALMIGTASLLEWYKTASRQPPRPLAGSPTAPSESPR